MAARGERRAFEVLFTRYHRELYSYCWAILGEPEEAHDALQNTMAVALRHLPAAERRTSLRGWLYRVAHNEAVSMLRGRLTTIDPVELPERTAPGADVRFEERERLRQLFADLAGLPARQRSALVMRELSDLSYSQIAAALETSGAGARQLVYEARESLRAVEHGRELDCVVARRAISARDGRVFRGRRLRAHLRACAACRAYRAAIETRRDDLAALFPPLAPGAASGLLASLLGGLGQGGASSGPAGTAGATAAIGGGGGAAVGGVGLKAASIASVVALGAGAAGISGGIKSPFRTGDEPAIANRTPAAAPTPRPSPGTPGPAANATEPASAGSATRPMGHTQPERRDADGGRPDPADSTPGASRPTGPGPVWVAGSSPIPTDPPPTASAGPAADRGGPAPTPQPTGQPASTPSASSANRPAQAGTQSSAAHASPHSDAVVALGGRQLAPDKPLPDPSTQRISANTKPGGGNR
jgi:RNA polymerase sigma factor (sigma-70 family)